MQGIVIWTQEALLVLNISYLVMKYCHELYQYREEYKKNGIAQSILDCY